MQQQQPADYDLLAVFNDETTAEATAAKLRKEGFSEDEVFQLASGTVGAGQFREHGPNANRRDIFLQTQRSGPNPLLIILLAVIFGIVFGGAGFVLSLILIFVVHLIAFAAFEPATIIGGGVLGIIVGAVTALLRRGPVRGDIGQSTTRTTTPTSRAAVKEARTVVALRFPDADDIKKKSRARAILISNGGKIDRSVGRTE